MFMSGSDKVENTNPIGDSTNPEPIDRPAVDTGFDSAPPTAATAGSATQLNAFYQDLEDEIAKAHSAINEIADKAKAYVNKFQNQGQ